METVRDFILGGSKITADGDCSHEIKRHLLFGRKAMTNLDSILKSRDTTLPTTVRPVKAVVFPVVMFGCESWTIKKAEHRRIDAFELWVLEKTLESPLDCKEIQPVHPKEDQSVLGVHWKDWWWSGNSNTLVTWCEQVILILWLPDVKNWFIGKDSDAGKNWRWEEKETTEDEMAGWHYWWTWVWVSSRSWLWTGKPGVLQSLGLQRVRLVWATELNWILK